MAEIQMALDSLDFDATMALAEAVHLMLIS